MRRRSTGDVLAAWISEEGSFRRHEPGRDILPQEHGSTAGPRVQKAATFPYQGPALSPFGPKMGVAQSTFDLGQDAMMGLIPRPLSFPEALQNAEAAATDQQQSSDFPLDTLFDPSLPISPNKTYVPEEFLYGPELFSHSFLGGLSQDLMDEPVEPFMNGETWDLCYLPGPHSEDYSVNSVQMQGICSTESQLGDSSVTSELIIGQDSIMVDSSGNTGLTIENPEDEEESDCQATSKYESANMARPHAGKTFACPYYRLDPIQHIDCISRKLNRIQDIKQHLSRRHFVKQNEQDVLDNTKRVSFSAQDSLKTRVDRRLPAREQWQEIWGILFKTTDLKGSPYLGDTEEEVIGIAIDVFQNKSNGKVSGLLKNRGLPASSAKNVQRLMATLFEESRCCSRQAEQEPDTAESTQSEGDQLSNIKELQTNSASESRFGASSTTGGDGGHESAILTSRSLTPCDGVDCPSEETMTEATYERNPSPLVNYLINQSDEQKLVTELSLDHEFWVQIHPTDSGCHFNDALTMRKQPETREAVHDTSNIPRSSGSLTPKSPSPSLIKVEMTQAKRKGRRKKREDLKSTALSTVKPMWVCCHCYMVHPYGNAQVCPNYPCEHPFNPNCCSTHNIQMKKTH